MSFANSPRLSMSKDSRFLTLPAAPTMSFTADEATSTPNCEISAIVSAPVVIDFVTTCLPTLTAIPVAATYALGLIMLFGRSPTILVTESCILPSISIGSSDERKDAWRSYSV